MPSKKAIQIRSCKFPSVRSLPQHSNKKHQTDKRTNQNHVKHSIRKKTDCNNSKMKNNLQSSFSISTQRAPEIYKIDLLVLTPIKLFQLAHSVNFIKFNLTSLFFILPITANTNIDILTMRIRSCNITSLIFILPNKANTKIHTLAMQIRSCNKEVSKFH